MPELMDFAKAKSKFGDDKEAVNYFVLVELYGKHLSEEKKDKFLSANSIDDMLDVLDERQLKHLRSLLGASLYQRSFRAHDDPEFDKEAFSEWFIQNVLNRGFEIDYKGLPPRIYDKQIAKTKAQDLIFTFKSRLKRFDGDLEEYCQWLILLGVDNSIPSIERAYDVHRLLKSLDLTRLEKLLKSIEKKKIGDIVDNMKYLEPTFYQIATKDLKYANAPDSNILLNNVESNFTATTPSKVHGLFEIERNKLIAKIKNLINEKNTIVESTIAKLGTSKTFEDSLTQIGDLVGGDDEVFLKEAIGEYSKVGASGSAFNRFLREAQFFKELSEKKFSSDTLQTFRKRIAQASAYFERHLTDKEYTVYRGMGSDGLKALLDKSNPKICYKTTDDQWHKLIIDDDLINEINKRNPIVFDEGFASTSLNKGVSGHKCFFKGKNVGNVFFTIKIPLHSKALVLDYEGIRNVPHEEEVLLTPRTKMKLTSIKDMAGHYEIEAEVVK